MQLVIFDPRLGNEETAEKKVLYYHPATTPKGEQVKVVGLCEAVTNLLSTFTQHDCESVHTRKGRQVYLQPEPNLWLVLIAPHPVPPSKASSSSTAATEAAAKAQLELEECAQLPASEEAVQDGALQAVLRRVYATLRMTCGPLSGLVARRGVDALRSLLSQLMPLLCKLVLSPYEEDPSRPDLLDTIQGMPFLPVDPMLFLQVQYVVNCLLTRYECIQHVMVMHADHLVWSSLTRDATQLLHGYLVSAIASAPPHPSKAERLQLNTSALPDEALAIGLALVHRQLRAYPKAALPAGGFVCGAADALQDSRSAVRVPCVHIERQPGWDPNDPDAAPSAPAPAADAAYPSASASCASPPISPQHAQSSAAAGSSTAPPTSGSGTGIHLGSAVGGAGDDGAGIGFSSARHVGSNHASDSSGDAAGTSPAAAGIHTSECEAGVGSSSAADSSGDAADTSPAAAGIDRQQTAAMASEPVDICDDVNGVAALSLEDESSAAHSAAASSADDAAVCAAAGSSTPAEAAGADGAAVDSSTPAEAAGADSAAADSSTPAEAASADGAAVDSSTPAEAASADGAAADSSTPAEAASADGAAADSSTPAEAASADGAATDSSSTPAEAASADGAATDSSSTPAEAASASAARPSTVEDDEVGRLVIFQLQQTVFAMLVDDKSAYWSQPSWYHEVSAMLVPELQPLAGKLAGVYARLLALDDPHRFYYYNKDNSALKAHSGGLFSKGGRTQPMGLAPEVKVALERMHADLSASSPVTEVTLHAGSHGWIFGRKSGARGLYLLLDGREYAWSEVQHEVAALLNGPHFSSVFLE